MAKKRVYAILTTDSTRIEVKAYNVTDAYREARKKLIKFKKDKKLYGKGLVNDETDLTESYMTFGRDGINTTGFKTTETSIKAFKRYSLILNPTKKILNN